MQSLILNQNGAGAPATRGEMRIVQILPGRIGLRISALKHAKTYAQEVKQTLEKIPGLKEIDINTLTGSMLITYDSDHFNDTQCQLMLEKLRQLFPGMHFEKIANSLKRIIR